LNGQGFLRLGIMSADWQDFLFAFICADLCPIKKLGIKQRLNK